MKIKIELYPAVFIIYTESRNLSSLLLIPKQWLPGGKQAGEQWEHLEGGPLCKALSSPAPALAPMDAHSSKIICSIKKKKTLCLLMRRSCIFSPRKSFLELNVFQDNNTTKINAILNNLYMIKYMKTFRDRKVLSTIFCQLQMRVIFSLIKWGLLFKQIRLNYNNCFSSIV